MKPLAERVRELIAVLPICVGSESFDRATRYELSAIAAELERLAEEMRGQTISDRVAQARWDGWTDQLAERRVPK